TPALRPETHASGRRGEQPGQKRHVLPRLEAKRGYRLAQRLPVVSTMGPEVSAGRAAQGSSPQPDEHEERGAGDPFVIQGGDDDQPEAWLVAPVLVEPEEGSAPADAQGNCVDGAVAPVDADAVALGGQVSHRA